MEDINMKVLKTRELLNKFLSSNIIQTHKSTQDLLDIFSAESLILNEKIHEIRQILNSDYMTTDYDLLEMLSQYFDPMHVFKILSEYVEPNKLIKELLYLFRLRGSESIKYLLFEVFLKYYNLATVIDYEKGELIIDSSYDLERFLDYYYDHGYIIDLDVMETVRVLARELLVGGHRLRLSYLGILIEICAISDVNDKWNVKEKVTNAETIDDVDDDVVTRSILTEEIGPPTSAGVTQIQAENEVLNNDWTLGKVLLNEFEGKWYDKISDEAPELETVVVHLPVESIDGVMESYEGVVGKSEFPPNTEEVGYIDNDQWSAKTKVDLVDEVSNYISDEIYCEYLSDVDTLIGSGIIGEMIIGQESGISKVTVRII
jgi:hypothetical protein